MSSPDTYAKQYSELFDFLSAPNTPAEAHGVLAFGRQDLLVASAAVDLSREQLADYVVFTGGKGKDSGSLAIPEATFLANGAASIAQAQGVTLPSIYTETAAENGVQNIRNSLALMKQEGLAYQAGLICVAHATSSRRLASLLTTNSAAINEPVAPVYNVPTDYVFNPRNPIDRQEAVGEMMRFVKWPDLAPFRDDLPPNLVDFAIDQDSRRQ